MKRRWMMVGFVAAVASAWAWVHLAAGDPISPASNRDYSWVQQIDPNHLAAATAAKNNDYVWDGSWVATFEPNAHPLRDPNCTSMGAVPATAVRWNFTPCDGNQAPVRYGRCGADGNYPAIAPAGIYGWPLTAADANGLQFWCSQTVRWNVSRFKPRN